MKKILFIALLLPTLLIAREPKQDTLFVADMSGADTTIWISKAYINFGAKRVRIEFDYSTFSDVDPYVKIVSRSIANGTALDYNVGDATTDTAYIFNNAAKAVRFRETDFDAEEFGFYFNKGSATNDTLIYNYRQD